MSTTPSIQSLQALLARLLQSADDVSVFEGAKLLFVESIKFSCLNPRCPQRHSLSVRDSSEHVLRRWLQFAADIELLCIERESEKFFKFYVSARICPAMQSKRHDPLVWAALSISVVSGSVFAAYMSVGCDDSEAHRVPMSSSSTRTKAGQWRLYPDSERDYDGIWAIELATYLCAKVAVGAVLRP